MNARSDILLKTIKVAFLMMIAIFSTADKDAIGSIWQFSTTLNGSQVVPIFNTQGRGTATSVFDDQTGIITISGRFDDLTNVPNDVTLNGFAPIGSNAPLLFGLNHTFATSGAFTGSGTIPSERIQDVLNGLTYINVRTAFNSGEIRGQLINPTAVPEPSSLLILIASGIVFCYCKSRLRRNRPLLRQETHATVDAKRFRQRPSLPEKPPLGMVFRSYFHEENGLAILRYACEA